MWIAALRQRPFFVSCSAAAHRTGLEGVNNRGVRQHFLTIQPGDRLGIISATCILDLEPKHCSQPKVTKCCLTRMALH